MTDATEVEPPKSSSSKRDQFNVNLCGLGTSLRAYAADKRISASCAIRIAIARLLETAASTPAGPSVDEPTHAGSAVRVLLRMSEPAAAMLVGRARNAGVSRSQYVVLLMEGETPAPLPLDHERLIASLMASTVQLASLSADLNAFMRLLGRLPSAALEPYRAGLRSLIPAVHAHLERAAALLASLERTQRWRK
ncbi:hypothetical protein LXT12_13385 [Pelomonas sp. P7]|uniref:Ribbon-helix-helix protein, copG family n=1 Tax=Pelomonas caseinilytica TaxID=2906763 RepID=A0ABS8XLY7_9BURK|nr:hypothetical protein [Pelomonas sp. P7]MCE4538245.1 hypothetical protein [Pelomonas sp. P7]